MLLANKFIPGDTVQVDFREVEKDDGKRVKDFVFEVTGHEDIPEFEDLLLDLSESDDDPSDEPLDELAALLAA